MAGAAPEGAARRTVDPAEIDKFSALAADWWDPAGSFAPLHRLNPTRLAFIRERVCAHFGRGARGLEPFAGLELLDIGCGGGLVSEPMARLGATVTGIDAGDAGLEAARSHAGETELAIAYRRASAEELAAEGAQFDVVLNLEVVEHALDPLAFLTATAVLVRPGGALVAATLNRTAKAFLLAVVGAEYVLGWLPRGTHDWRKFVRPAELARGLAAGGVEITELTGVAFDPLGRRWRLAPRDLAVNYMAFGVKRG